MTCRDRNQCDAEALRDLYVRYRGRVQTYTEGIVRDPHQACGSRATPRSRAAPAWDDHVEDA